MNCLICGKECNEAFLRLGGYCSEEHRQEILARHRQLLEELRQEEAALMPEVFCVPLFERFALKLAVHLLRGMSEKVLGMYRQRAPTLLDPLEMAQELKAHILHRLPSTHVVLQEARGLARLFRDGSYSFIQPVPAALVAEAVREAGLLPLLGTVPEQDPESDDPDPPGDDA